MSDAEAVAYRRKLALNMSLNAGWSWVFFRGHKIVPSFLVAGGHHTSGLAGGRLSR